MVYGLHPPLIRMGVEFDVSVLVVAIVPTKELVFNEL
jgi:hypothetical protein